MQSTKPPVKGGEGIVWLKLSQTSAEQLRQAFPPQYPNQFYDHVTLVFGAQKTLYEDLVGNHATIRVYAYAKNDEVEAVRVHTGALPDTYGVPHITLSTQKGIKPFASVMMLQGDHHETEIQPFELEGHIEFIEIT